MQEQLHAADKQLQSASVSAQTAKYDQERQQLTAQTQTQALQQQLKELRSEHQQLHDKFAGFDSKSPGSLGKLPARPSVLNGVRAVLQRLNGGQNGQALLPVSVPSLIIGHQQGGTETPTHLDPAGASSSQRGSFQQPQAGHSQQPQAAGVNADVAGPSGREEDEWDVLLK